MNRLQSAVVDVGIFLRRRDAGVSEDFLKGPNFRAACEHVRRKAMPECVRADILTTPDAGGVFLDEMPNPQPRETASAACE